MPPLRTPASPKDREIQTLLREVVLFSGFQGARTQVDRYDEDQLGRKRIQVRVFRGGAKKDWTYEILIEANGLVGIYRTV